MTDNTIKLYLHGLIMRDPSCPAPLPASDPYWQTRRGKAAKNRDAKRKAEWASGARRLISLQEPGALKWVEVTRASCRKLIRQGWTFDEETTAWARTS